MGLRKDSCLRIDNMVFDSEIEKQTMFATKVKDIIKNKYAIAPKYYIQTLGCQQNEADSERLAGWAEFMGYVKTEDPNEAKLILVNTCAVREHAEIRAISFVGEYKHVKDADPEVIIGVGGCMMAEAHRVEKFKKSCSYVDFSFDPAAIHRLPEFVYSALNKFKRTFVTTEKPIIVEGVPFVRQSGHNAWLSIMYGCNNFCSYCIVPYTRGRERSRSKEAVLEEAKILIASGAKDITLLGQNVNSYGKDLENGSTIAELMHEICKLDGDFRLRFMTSHPKDASDELIAAIAEEEKVVKHFHLPVQSGSNEILKKMNRKYTVEKYLDTVDKIKKADSDISITSDIIVGFPGETEEDFVGTLNLIKAVGYDMTFAFVYSPRVGTPAARMENQIPHDVSIDRMNRLMALQNDIALERNKRFVGRTLKCIVDDVSKNNKDFLTARGDPVKPIHFEGDKSLIGQFVNLEITGTETFSFKGKLIK